MSKNLIDLYFYALFFYGIMKLVNISTKLDGVDATKAGFIDIMMI